MSIEEATKFESSEFFKEKLILRYCDENAKDADLKLKISDNLKKICLNHLNNNLK